MMFLLQSNSAAQTLTAGTRAGSPTGTGAAGEPANQSGPLFGDLLRSAVDGTDAIPTRPANPAGALLSAKVSAQFPGLQLAFGRSFGLQQRQVGVAVTNGAGVGPIGLETPSAGELIIPAIQQLTEAAGLVLPAGVDLNAAIELPGIVTPAEQAGDTGEVSLSVVDNEVDVEVAPEDLVAPRELAAAGELAAQASTSFPVGRQRPVEGGPDRQAVEQAETPSEVVVDQAGLQTVGAEESSFELPKAAQQDARGPVQPLVVGASERAFEVARSKPEAGKAAAEISKVPLEGDALAGDIVPTSTIDRPLALSQIVQVFSKAAGAIEVAELDDLALSTLTASAQEVTEGTLPDVEGKSFDESTLEATTFTKDVSASDDGGLDVAALEREQVPNPSVDTPVRSSDHEDSVEHPQAAGKAAAEFLPTSAIEKSDERIDTVSKTVIEQGQSPGVERSVEQRVPQASVASADAKRQVTQSELSDSPLDVDTEVEGDSGLEVLPAANERPVSETASRPVESRPVAVDRPVDQLLRDVMADQQSVGGSSHAVAEAASTALSSAEAPRIGRSTRAGSQNRFELPSTASAVAMAAAGADGISKTTGTEGATGTQPKATVTAVATQVTNAIQEAVETGASPLRVRLDPPELGRVTVEVRRDAGEVQIEIRFESMEGLKAAREGIEGLRESLATKGIELEPEQIRLKLEIGRESKVSDTAGANNEEQSGGRDGFQRDGQQDQRAQDGRQQRFGERGEQSRDHARDQGHADVRDRRSADSDNFDRRLAGRDARSTSRRDSGGLRSLDIEI